MFKWYRDSTICIVYLQDLPVSSDGLASKDSRFQLDQDLWRCRWFRRGWTLQELIAPKNILFYDSQWSEHGTKSSLESNIIEVTGIPSNVLRDSDNLSTIPVGRRMSWASMRVTTRVEDLAYSFLGIFDINMPLIYGEGRKAFIRLQEGIIQQTNDLSLFAWTTDADQRYHGIFATSPQQFRRCDRLENSADPIVYERLSFANTNRGLQFQHLLETSSEEGDYLMNLHCRDNTESARNMTLAIRLTKTIDGFVRHRMQKLIESQIGIGRFETFYVHKVVSAAESQQIALKLNNSVQFVFRSSSKYHYQIAPSWSSPPWDVRRPHFWDGSQNRFLTGSRPTFTGLLDLKIDFQQDPQFSDPHLDGKFKIICGFWPVALEDRQETGQKELRPWACLYQPNDKSAFSNKIYTKVSGLIPVDLRETLDLEGKIESIQLSLRLSKVMRESLLQGFTRPHPPN